MKRLISAVLLLLASASALAVTPTISGVSGTVSVGNRLTVSGTHMLDDTLVSQDSGISARQRDMESTGATSSVFSFCSGGSSFTTSNPFMGARSLDNFASGASTTSAHGGSEVCLQPATKTAEFWWCENNRWVTVSSWPNSSADPPNGTADKFKWMGGGGAAAFSNWPVNNSGGVNTPTGLDMMQGNVNGGNFVTGSLPFGAVDPEIWYHVCTHVKGQEAASPYPVELWVNGTRIVNITGAPAGWDHGASWISYDPNWWATDASFSRHHYIDDIRISQVQPRMPQFIEIGDNAGNWVHCPAMISGTTAPSVADGTSYCKVKALPAGGATKMRVTNNLGETSAEFSLGGGDVTAPILSSATASGVTSAQMVPGVTTDEGNGTLYMVVVPDTDTPSAAQIRAGQRSNGTAAINAQNIAVSSSGAKTFATVTGLSASTNYDVWFTQQDSSGNNATAIKADVTTLAASGGTTLFTEPFENASYTSRGWYDATGTATPDSSTFGPGGSTASFNCHWNLAATDCAGGSPHRHLFTATDTVYVSFYMKLGSSTVTWQGSGASFHPHIFQILTDADDAFVGPNSSTFSALIETHLFTPRLAQADSASINVPDATATPGAGPSRFGTTTPHAVAGCNGSQNASAQCFACPPPSFPTAGAYCNGTFWDAAAPAFVNNTWHKVEVYFQMNSTFGGADVGDGIMRAWVDGALVVNQTNVYFRDGGHGTRKFNQLLLAPYIGNGSPIAQDLWIDNLTVATAPPATSQPTHRLRYTIH